MIMKIAWFSCGITSAVACKIAVEKYGKHNVKLFYIGIQSAHYDNDRFISDCEKWIGTKIIYTQNDKYKDQYDVINKTGYVNGVMGARCTLELKKKVRWKIEKDYNFDGQIFGFEYSKKEINRAVRFSQQYPESKPLFPLIERKVTKQKCAEILLINGIELPEMYNLGFHNNNCIGCVKGGKGYWNMIRKHFPDYFKKMAEAERQAGHSCIKDLFLDQLKENEGKHESPILPDCGTFCEIEFADIIDPITEEIIQGRRHVGQLSLF